MTDDLPVHVSRQELHSLDVPASFAADGPFDVVFENHGESVHVHVHLSDALSEVASIEASNHYVEGGSRRAVRVHVDTEALPAEPVLGKLKLVSSYGAQTRWVDVELSPPDGGDDTVEVDESLASPRPRTEPEDAGPVPERPELPVLGLGALALVVAVVAVLYIQDTLVILGSLAVLAGVSVALFYLVRE